MSLEESSKHLLSFRSKKEAQCSIPCQRNAWWSGLPAFEVRKIHTHIFPNCSALSLLNRLPLTGLQQLPCCESAFLLLGMFLHICLMAHDSSQNPLIATEIFLKSINFSNIHGPDIFVSFEGTWIFFFYLWICTHRSCSGGGGWRDILAVENMYCSSK